MARPPSTYEAVSYTHLDVYKRQGQLRGGLGQLCTLLPAEEVTGALRAVAGNRQKTPQERTTAALILQRFLDQPSPTALLADLAGADEAPYQSLLEAVNESKRNRHVPVSYTHLDVYKRQSVLQLRP